MGLVQGVTDRIGARGVVFLRCVNSSSNLLDVRPLIRSMISLGATFGGQLVRIWTWSLLTTPFTILISSASQVSLTSSRARSAISVLSTPQRYFDTQTK